LGVVPSRQSCIAFLAAGLLWLCGVLPAHALHAWPSDGVQNIPISTVKTRVGDFSFVASGRLPWRHELSPANTPGSWGCGYEMASGRGDWNDRDPNGYTFCGGDSVNSFDSNGRLDPNAPDEADVEQSIYFQNDLYRGDPAAVRAMQQNGGMETYYNGDATAYLQGQNDRAAEQVAVAIPVMTVAAIASIPAAPAEAEITMGSLVTRGLISAGISGAAAGTVAYETGEPIIPATAGGFVAGAITGPAGAYAQTLTPFAGFAVNSTAGFVGNYTGSTVNQISANGSYDPNQSLFAGILGGVLNPAEANISASGEDFLQSTIPSFKQAGSVSLDYTIGLGDSAFGSFVEPTVPSSASQPNGAAYTPGPLGQKY
jgi:hypothetical protein